MASAAASTNTSPIRCRTWSSRCARPLPALAPIANRWNEAMGLAVRYPAEHAAFLARCHRPARRGRRRCCCGTAGRLQLPAPGPLRRASLSAAGRDPAQRARRDFTGGEFVLTEQRPRMQSRAEVVPLEPGRRRHLRRARAPGAGDARDLPRQHAPRGEPAACGRRFTLGIIFHDARRAGSLTPPAGSTTRPHSGAAGGRSRPIYGAHR